MNYGDGMYAGQFIGAHVCRGVLRERPGEDRRGRPAGHPRRVPVRRDGPRPAGLVPRATRTTGRRPGSLCQKKYRENPEYQKASNGGIDCKINGAYVLMGLLYGKRRSGPDDRHLLPRRAGFRLQSLQLRRACCSPRSASRSCPSASPRSSNENDDLQPHRLQLPGLLDVCEKLARQVAGQARRPGREGRGRRGGLRDPGAARRRPSKLELSWAPGPIANSRFTEEEMAQINANSASMPRAVEKFAPGWKITNCGTDMDPGLRAECGGKKNVFVTHPLDREHRLRALPRSRDSRRQEDHAAPGRRP